MRGKSVYSRIFMVNKNLCSMIWLIDRESVVIFKSYVTVEIIIFDEPRSRDDMKNDYKKYPPII